jgi:hypothetical protein
MSVRDRDKNLTLIVHDFYDYTKNGINLYTSFPLSWAEVPTNSRQLKPFYPLNPPARGTLELRMEVLGPIIRSLLIGNSLANEAR